jgi:shikimate dehydrogenase
MLFEQIPAYLEFFGLPTTTPEQLRRWAQLVAPTPERIPA